MAYDTFSYVAWNFNNNRWLAVRCRTDDRKVSRSNPGRDVIGFIIVGKLFHTCVFRPTQPSIPPA